MKITLCGQYTHLNKKDKFYNIETEEKNIPVSKVISKFKEVKGLASAKIYALKISPTIYRLTLEEEIPYVRPVGISDKSYQELK